MERRVFQLRAHSLTGQENNQRTRNIMDTVLSQKISRVKDSNNFFKSSFP